MERMAENCCKIMEMFKNGRKWLEMAENDSKLMERLEMAVNGFK